MTGKKIILMIALAAPLIASGLVGETEKPPAAQPLESNEIPYSTDVALAELESNYDLWLEATLGGNTESAAKYEKNLLGIVNYDIMRSQEILRAAAKSAALSTDKKANQVVEDSTVTKPSPLQASINHLNTKEALYRSLTRTSAFSNKYRLLGDYIGLLRKEIKMPQLYLADTEDNTRGTDSK